MMDIPHPATLPCAWPLGCTRMAGGYDHDHETDRVRAALCQHHNATLGASGDTPESLRTVADWLESANMGFTYVDAQRSMRRVSNRRWQADHPDRVRAHHAKTYADNREYCIEYARQRRIRMAID